LFRARLYAQIAGLGACVAVIGGLMIAVAPKR